ncbi:MAG: GNAT family N-acetyltransferase [Cyanobacteria bacterium J069]|nr:MAG: GNAT family N-acetyltransferase [Cyanobacteria bacterium J069]
MLIRPLLRRDLEVVERLMLDALEADTESGRLEVTQRVQQLRRWYGLLKGLSLFPNPLQHLLSTYVAEQNDQLQGVIQVSPFNRTRSTWRIEQIAVGQYAAGEPKRSSLLDAGSQLLRYCLQTIWEARTWLIEVDVNDNSVIGLCRQTGFQPLAQMTYWAIAPDLWRVLADRQPDLPNLLPVSNADAGLLYQLDTVSMPPHVRQVFDRHIADFKSGLLSGVTDGLGSWFTPVQHVSGYVFEPQRKVAIGYFQLQLCKDGSQPHEANLKVHPAYTWLYPELFCQIAQVVKGYPEQSLVVDSADYQPEREDFLQQLGAEPTHHTLMMSRSVWHKLREAKPLEGLQLTDMLQNLQPARKPVPSRFSLESGTSAKPNAKPPGIPKDSN